ncbi:MAG: thioredoxin family protein [Planctomycetota bacterium]|jgi:thiol:disulfide interchange protein DsbD|nr:thioredoxin family protein [Planctomycetota bacterium]
MLIRFLLAAFISAITTLGAAGELSFGNFGGNSFGLSPAAGMREKKLLDVALIPESAVVGAGKPFTVVVALRHSGEGYTYWKNPGGPGRGSDISWRLPDGFSVSEPEWPAPELYSSSGITSYIYKGVVNIPFTITPPRSLAPGDAIDIQADVDTQVCTTRTCTPEKIPASARMTAGEKTGTVNPIVEKARLALPVRPEGWSVAVEPGDGLLALRLKPATGVAADPGSVYFFDASSPAPLVDSQSPQTLQKDGTDWVLTLPLKRVGSEIRRLSGILRAENGWLDGKRIPDSFMVSHSFVEDEASALTAPRGGPKTTLDARMLLAFAFIGGLLLNVMPCVFPVISLKVMGFAKQAHKDRRSIFMHGLAYGAGVLICFWILGGVVISLGRGWGAQLQSPPFVFLLCNLFVVMALNMAGTFEIGASAASAGHAIQDRVGIKRSFLTGLLATVTSTPCSAPFLGSALAYALSLPAHLALGVFTLMGIGFALPYLALALFPNWLKKLPKPGPWMDAFRQAMSFPLFAAGFYMLWTLEAMIDEWRLLMTLFGLVAVAFACWLYGHGQKMRHAHVHGKTAGRRRLLPALAAVGIAAGLWLGWPSPGQGVQWREWSPELVQSLLGEGKAVYVDFTARWCATCQVNKRVYKDPGVAGLIDEKKVVLLKADWTRYDERITEVLRDEFNKAAVPVTALYVPGESRPRLLPELLTVGNVSAELGALP